MTIMITCSWIFPVVRCSRVPRYILVENVKGFETSAMRDELIRVLTNLDFNYQVHTYCTFVCECCTLIAHTDFTIIIIDFTIIIKRDNSCHNKILTVYVLFFLIVVKADRTCHCQHGHFLLFDFFIFI